METPLTPQQLALENDLPKVPEFKNVKEEVSELKAGQDKIIEMIEEEKAETREEFAKGSQMFKDLYDKVGKMENQIADGFKNISKDFSDYKLEVKDNRIDNLTKKLDSKNHVKNGIIITLVGGILLAVAFYALSNIGISVK